MSTPERISLGQPCKGFLFVWNLANEDTNSVVAMKLSAFESVKQFLKLEAAAGILLILTAAAAIFFANSSLRSFYFGLQHIEVLGMLLLHWINDGLMAVFFLLVGLELKREILVGQLSSWQQRMLPGVAAIGGMIVPAVIYVWLNIGHPENMRGWAVPMATDIAFALGVLALVGSSVPVSLKIFLTALAIIDDLGAVVVIAVFYTSDVSAQYLLLSILLFITLCILNLRGVSKILPYLLIGAFLWLCVLKSGIHSTLAGVMLALAIPLSGGKSVQGEAEPLTKLEHGLHPWVAFIILPTFGFVNAGVSVDNLSLESLAEPVTLGVMVGLFVGKQVGVLGFSWIAIRAGWAELPRKSNWVQFYGVALLGGIGFTMSLFIGALGFIGKPLLLEQTKIGVLAGSLLSALLGAWLLAWSGTRARA